MLKNMKILRRAQFTSGPKRLATGDKLHVTITCTDLLGSESLRYETPPVTEPVIFDEAAIFEGDFEGRLTYGGMVLERVK